MEQYIKLISRTDSYKAWKDLGSVVRPSEGEVCVIMADDEAVLDGYAIAKTADVTGTQRGSVLNKQYGRKPVPGEPLGIKIGDGVRVYNDLPFLFPFSEIYLEAAEGRNLEQPSQAGSEHKYRHPYDALDAIFRAPYSPPTGSFKIVAGGVTTTGTRVVKMGQELTNAVLTTTASKGSNRVNAIDVIWGGTDTAPQTEDKSSLSSDTSNLASHSYGASGEYGSVTITTADKAMNGGLYYRRSFWGRVKDAQEKGKGGTWVNTNTANIDGVFPTYMIGVPPGYSSATFKGNPHTWDEATRVDFAQKAIDGFDFNPGGNNTPLELVLKKANVAPQAIPNGVWGGQYHVMYLIPKVYGLPADGKAISGGLAGEFLNNGTFAEHATAPETIKQYEIDVTVNGVATQYILLATYDQKGADGVTYSLIY